MILIIPPFNALDDTEAVLDWFKIEPILSLIYASKTGRPSYPHGLAQTRFMGLAQNMTAYGIAAIAHNLRKGARFLTLYGLPNPNCAG